MSNSWMVPMTDRNTLIRIVGPSRGRVTCRNACQAVAPSVTAASDNSLGIPCRAARKSIM